MIEAPEPIDENERLAKLQSYEVLDTMPEQQFDDLTHLASQICGSKISLVSLVDKDRQWFKSRVGLDAEQTPREYAFCAHAIHGDELFYVPDATKDERFSDNPLVTGSPHVKFYAGAPVITPEGHRLGSLCVIDDHPRELSDEQKDSLIRLSRQVASNLELRLHIRELESTNKLMAKKNEELQQFAYSTSHDLRAPITSTKRLAAYLIEDIEEGRLEEALEGGRDIHRLMGNLEKLVTNIVSLVRADVSSFEAEAVDVTTLLAETQQRLELMAKENECRVRITNNCPTMLTLERYRVSQIIDNLVSNGIKFRDISKPDCYVNVAISSESSAISITVEDNGIGIPTDFQGDMFAMFKRHVSDIKGSGLGLSIVRKHVDHLQGTINCTSSDQGTKFDVSIPQIVPGN